MLQFMVLALSLIIALIRGGRFSKMPRFRYSWTLLLPVVIEALAIIIPSIAPLMASVAYVFIIFFLAVNWSTPEIRLTLIGVCMNALVIWVNGGVMPVSHFIHYTSLQRLPAYDYNEFWHAGLSGHTIFPILSDIIYLRYPIPTLLSAGDIFLFSGIAFLIQRLLGVPVLLSKLAGASK